MKVLIEIMLGGGQVRAGQVRGVRERGRWGEGVHGKDVGGEVNVCLPFFYNFVLAILFRPPPPKKKSQAPIFLTTPH